MLAPLKNTVLIGIPFAHIFFRPRIFKHPENVFRMILQPFVVTRKFPLTIALDDFSHLTVHTSQRRIHSVFQRKIDPKAGGSAVLEGVFHRNFPNGSFELRKQIRHDVRIVPDVLAGAEAGAYRFTAPLPAPERAVFKSQCGRGFDDRKVCRDRILHIFGQCA